MRVLIVTPYRRAAGGVESVNRMVQSVFESEGHEVDYLTSEDVDNETWDIRARFERPLIGLPAVTAAGYRRVTAKDYDLVLANGEFAWGIDHPNTVCVFHGSYLGLRDHMQAHLSPRQYASLSWQAHVQRVAARNKPVIAVSRFVAEILERQKIHVSLVIENCVDTHLFQPANRPASTSKYLFVGSYHRFSKGFDVLETLAESGIDIDCATDRPPGHRLGSLGRIAHEDMPDVYRRYRMLIFPSRFEAFGLAPLEAMSCGLPVVMTSVGIGHSLRATLPEFVVDLPASASALASAFAERIARIESDYEHFATAARDYALRNHSSAQFARAWGSVARKAPPC